MFDDPEIDILFHLSQALSALEKKDDEELREALLTAHARIKKLIGVGGGIPDKKAETTNLSPLFGQRAASALKARAHLK